MSEHKPIGGGILTFEEWFTEIEGFGLRCERFYNDVDLKSIDRMKQWLIAAYNTGYNKGYADGFERGSKTS